MIHSSSLKIIFLYLNNFPQNKHITMLFIAHMSILLMPRPVNQFLALVKKPYAKLGSGRRKKERSLERWPLLQIPLFLYFAHFSWCINPLTEALY